MKRIKITSSMYKVLLVIIAGICIYFLICSDIGFVAQEQAKKELLLKQQALRALKEEIAYVKQTTKDWETDSFELEKIARQDLCMGYTDEIVYLLPKE